MRRGLAAFLLVGLTATLALAANGYEQPRTVPSFYKEVLPILQRRCQSCHRPGQVAPMALLTYQQTRPWARAIKTHVINRTMPPWFADPAHGRFTNDRSLSQSEVGAIVSWVDGGAPPGDPKDAPAPVQWPDHGWQINPDVIVTLPAFQVPASGVVEWQSLAIPSPFEKDTWVEAVELLPGEPSVAHHICFEFQKPRPDVVHYRYEWPEVPRDESGVAVRGGLLSRLVEWIRPSSAYFTRHVGSSDVQRHSGRPTLKANGTFCYVPGMSVHDFRPFEAAKLVPGGSNIVLTIHYEPVGKAVVDTVRIGFKLANTDLKRKFVEIAVNGATDDEGFAIPPNDPNYAPPVNIEITEDSELVWLWPHMHVRGKDVTYRLVSANGNSDIILRIPRYDFQWQIAYETSIKVSRGSRLLAEAHYDNSRRNRANPNPGAWVYPGDQSWEEMFTPAFGLVVNRDVDEGKLTVRVR